MFNYKHHGSLFKFAKFVYIASECVLVSVFKLLPNFNKLYLDSMKRTRTRTYKHIKMWKALYIFITNYFRTDVMGMVCKINVKPYSQFGHDGWVSGWGCWSDNVGGGRNPPAKGLAMLYMKSLNIIQQGIIHGCAVESQWQCFNNTNIILSSCLGSLFLWFMPFTVPPPSVGIVS